MRRLSLSDYFDDSSVILGEDWDVLVDLAGRGSVEVDVIVVDDRRGRAVMRQMQLIRQVMVSNRSLRW